MSKTATSSGETKQDDIQLHFLGSVLIHPHAINEVPTPTDLGRWNLIFSFLDFDLHERLSVRNLCRLFHTVLPGPTFTGVYTIYPHPNHTSLRSLIDRLNAIASGGGSAEYLFIAKGILLSIVQVQSFLSHNSLTAFSFFQSIVPTMLAYETLSWYTTSFTCR